MSYDDYYKWSEEWINQTYKLLKSDGTIYIAIGDEFAAEINLILKRTGFNFRNWIIWYYTRNLTVLIHIFYTIRKTKKDSSLTIKI